MPALALTADLVLQSQLSAAAERAGVAVEIATSIEALVARTDAAQPEVVILDLAHSGLDPHELVPRLKSLVPQSEIVAFGPHVHRERLAAAKEAGCDTVISRGQFHAEMDAILKRCDRSQ